MDGPQGSVPRPATHACKKVKGRCWVENSWSENRLEKQIEQELYIRTQYDDVWVREHNPFSHSMDTLTHLGHMCQRIKPL